MSYQDVPAVVPTKELVAEFQQDAYIYCRKAQDGALNMQGSGERYWIAGNEWGELERMMEGKGHGQRFSSFIEERTGYTYDFVRKVILIARTYTRPQCALAISKQALLLLCYDGEAREEAIERATNGEVITENKARAIKKTSSKPKKSQEKKVGLAQPKPATNGEVKEESKADESESDESEPVKQKPVAHEVMRNHKAHEAAAAFKSIGLRLSRLVTEVTDLAAMKGGEKIDANQICADLRNAAEGVKDAAPFADCPYCKGRGCNTCDQLGWLAEFRWSSIDKVRRPK